MSGADRLHAQDLVLALKLALVEPYRPSHRDLAAALHESVGEIAKGRARLSACRLLGDDGSVRRDVLASVLVHAVGHIFPAALGRRSTGLPTGPGVGDIAVVAALDPETVWVWPTAAVNAPVPGRSVEPLYPAAPQAAYDDPALHGFLALIDILRIDTPPQPRRVAAEEIRGRLLGRR